MRQGMLVVLVALTALGVAAPVAAQEAPRQRAELVFTSAEPGAASGLELSIDYLAAGDDPDGKPYAVHTVVERLAEGAGFDTGAPEQCGASDAELMAVGPGACPAGSRVGQGEIDLDTGAPGQQRIVENDVTFFNNRDELIFLTESTNTPLPVRAVIRGRIEGREAFSEAPPLPGAPPPDPFAAVKRVRVSFDSIERAGRAYITTPPSCPQSGAWVNTVTFTYRDGVEQTEASASPCVEH